MRDRGSLAPVALIVFVSQIVYNVITKRFSGLPTIGSGGGIYPELFEAAPAVRAWIQACHARPGYKRMAAARDAEPA